MYCNYADTCRSEDRWCGCIEKRRTVYLLPSEFVTVLNVVRPVVKLIYIIMYVHCNLLPWPLSTYTPLPCTVLYKYLCSCAYLHTSIVKLVLVEPGSRQEVNLPCELSKFLPMCPAMKISNF